MEIRVVGIAKSGTNAVEKACRLIGLNPTHHEHTANYRLAKDHKVAYVYRNPRNVLISAVRYWNAQVRGETKDITEKKLIDMICGWTNTSFYALYLSHSKWLTSEACVMSFEGLMQYKSVMDSIADYMGVDRPSQETFLKLEGGTPTWTGKLSNWKDHWTDEVERIWVEEGMPEMEKLYGYENKY